MGRRLGSAVALAIGLALAGSGSVPATAVISAASCETLASLVLPNASINTAQSVTAGVLSVQGPGGGSAPPQTLSNLPALCRVIATLKPSADSNIRIEVWLPTANWNGKFMALGNGGFLGAINYGQMRDPLLRGYAVAATDTGHEGGLSDASWALGHPEKQIDFGYRSVHEMTVQAKAVVRAFYGGEPRLSYWNGCSSGGKQGLKEAQRFPDDYNGIIAGAPANNWVHLLTSFVAVAQAVRVDPADAIPPSKYPLINNAVMTRCDLADGVKDGILEDPRRCRFDPGVLQCTGALSDDCLTAPQVAALKKVYAPVKNSRTGQDIYPGLPVGSELGWANLPQPFAIAESHFRFIVFENPSWDFSTMNFDTDVARAEAIDARVGQFTATDPDLSAFKKRGGKLLQYHGWNDQQISAQNSIDYHDTVVARMGGVRETDDFYRLFMVPGMLHCGGGRGTDRFDTIAAMEQWVERGVAPARIEASHITDGKVDRTRPLCPYPQVAVYSGSGSTDASANFSCRVQP